MGNILTNRTAEDGIKTKPPLWEGILKHLGCRIHTIWDFIARMRSNHNFAQIWYRKKAEDIQYNTVDPLYEQHHPFAKLKGNHLTITIGDVPHPMTKNHSILWIAIIQGQLMQNYTLKQWEPAAATFHVEAEAVTVYVYCGLHGLWKTYISKLEFAEMRMANRHNSEG